MALNEAEKMMLMRTSLVGIEHYVAEWWVDNSVMPANMSQALKAVTLEILKCLLRVADQTISSTCFVSTL